MMSSSGWPCPIRRWPRAAVGRSGFVGRSSGQTLRERVRAVLGRPQPLALNHGCAGREFPSGGPRFGPVPHRSSRGGLFLFVNGRFVRNRTFIGALLSVYRERLPGPLSDGRALSPSSEDVDVNVHPAKVEVRWTDGPEVWRFVASAVAELLDRLAAGGHQQEGLFAGVQAGPAPLAPKSSPGLAPTNDRHPSRLRFESGILGADGERPFGIPGSSARASDCGSAARARGQCPRLGSA